MKKFIEKAWPAHALGGQYESLMNLWLKWNDKMDVLCMKYQI